MSFFCSSGLRSICNHLEYDRLYVSLLYMPLLDIYISFSLPFLLYLAAVSGCDFWISLWVFFPPEAYFFVAFPSI